MFEWLKKQYSEVVSSVIALTTVGAVIYLNVVGEQPLQVLESIALMTVGYFVGSQVGKAVGVAQERTNVNEMLAAALFERHDRTP